MTIVKWIPSALRALRVSVADSITITIYDYDCASRFGDFNPQSAIVDHFFFAVYTPSG
jgi:hypothetical protein